MTDDLGVDAATIGAAGGHRCHPRHLTSGNLGIISIRGEQDFCRVRNVSRTGLMAQVYRQIEVGENIRIETKSHHVVHGSVVWATQHVPALASILVRQVGIKFHEAVDVEPLLSSHCSAEPGHLQRRPRIQVSCPVRVSADMRQLSGELCDISQGGAKIQVRNGLIGERRLSLLIRNLPPLHADVSWTHGSISGVTFHEAISLEPLIAWLRSYRMEAGPEASPFGTACPVAPAAFHG